MQKSDKVINKSEMCITNLHDKPISIPNFSSLRVTQLQTRNIQPVLLSSLPNHPLSCLAN